MKLLLLSLACALPFTVLAQYSPKKYHEFNGKKEFIFEDNFDKDLPEYDLLPDDPSDTTDKCVINTDSIDYKNGIVYVYNNCKEEVGNTAMIDIDYNRNFEIVIVAKLLYDENNRDNIQQGYLVWDINEKNGLCNKLYFSGVYNVFHTHTGKDSLTNKCIGPFKRLKKSKHYPTYEKFVRYTIRKYNNKYYIFVNGTLCGTFPFVKHNGTNIGYGARANSKAEFDYLGVYYLP